MRRTEFRTGRSGKAFALKQACVFDAAVGILDHLRGPLAAGDQRPRMLTPTAVNHGNEPVPTSECRLLEPAPLTLSPRPCLGPRVSLAMRDLTVVHRPLGRFSRFSFRSNF